MEKIVGLPKFKKLAAWVAIFSLLVISARTVLAEDPTVIRVNGTIIYETPDGYNASHGIAGVTFDVGTKILTLNNASLDNISAMGDLTINLVGTNTITEGTAIALEASGGNLTIAGTDGASLTINSPDRAIEIGVGKRLAIGTEGDSDNLITVTIEDGTVNSEDTYVVSGNTYNYDLPPGPGGPPAGDPLQISISGILVIDETADPQVLSASGEGWSISRGFMNMYQLEIANGASLGYITGSGDGELSIDPQGGNITISKNVDDFSINMNGNVNVFTGMGAVAGDIALAGGIYTQGEIRVDDRDMTIGTSETPSPQGILANRLSVGSGDLTIYTTGIGLQSYNPTPAAGEGLFAESRAGKILKVAASNMATYNVETIRVSGGGSVDLSFTDSLGSFRSEASRWPWTDMTGTEEENPQPITVVCDEDQLPEDKYQVSVGAQNFLLESTAGTLYQLGWNIPETDDSTVTNGTVNVVAANGYRFTSGGYTDYSIEAGSTVTIELLPDYGYQYVAGGLNGNTTLPDEGKASYTFVMPSNNLHLSAIFERANDKISVDSDKIAGASIVLPTGEINGNASFSVANATVPNTSGFTAAAGGATIGGYIDLSLDEVIYKGTTEDAWTTNITDLDQPMTVNLNLAKDLQGHTGYVVLRNHDGVISELSSAYDSSAGVLTFNTDKYSTYAIAYVGTATAAISTSNPQTYDGINNQIIIGLISLLGLVVLIFCSRRRRTRNTANYNN